MQLEMQWALDAINGQTSRLLCFEKKKEKENENCGLGGTWHMCARGC